MAGIDAHQHIAVLNGPALAERQIDDATGNFRGDVDRLQAATVPMPSLVMSIDFGSTVTV